MCGLTSTGAQNYNDDNSIYDFSAIVNKDLTIVDDGGHDTMDLHPVSLSTVWDNRGANDSMEGNIGMAWDADIEDVLVLR